MKRPETTQNFHETTRNHKNDQKHRNDKKPPVPVVSKLSSKIKKKFAEFDETWYTYQSKSY